MVVAGAGCAEGSALERGRGSNRLPTLVESLLGKAVSQIACGADHTVALTAKK